jgi:phosphotransferase system enzyme I (PtsI)
VSPGRVRAPLVRLAAPPRTSVTDPVGNDPAAEHARVERALAEVSADLAGRSSRAGGVVAEVLDATSALAADPELAGAVGRHLHAGAPTGHAVTLAVEEYCDRLAAHGGYLAERVTDLRDVGARAVAVLAGVPMPGIPAPGHPVVLAARDLAPADTATLPGGDVVALVTEQGGPTSHTAILARSLGLPAVVACPGIAAVAEGTEVLVDGTAGRVWVDPPAALRDDLPGAADRPAGAGPGRTRDGRAVPLLCNVGTLAEARAAGFSAAEGVGLLRTEFLFLGRRTRPRVTEQAEAYAGVLAAFGDRPVVVRTLDAGSDKPLEFLPLGAEDNPALGLRGLRTAAVHPDALDEQLAALAEAARRAHRPVAVMAPMVSTVAEARAFVARARAHGLERVGVMIEVPAAALRADELLAAVDFASIGTNDLAQYTMAADRAAGALGELLDPWQPAVLDLVALVGRAGRRHGTPVGVCGEAAADPLLAAVLVGLGADSLSTAVAARPGVLAELAGLTVDDCVALAEAARAATGPGDARAAARRVREARR